MITEDYVSLETAKLLKEKGFDEDTMCVYIGRYLRIKSLSTISNNTNMPVIPAPTHQMAAKWLRRKGMYINVNVNEREICDTNGNHESTYSYWKYGISNTTDGIYVHEGNEEYQFFEEAMEAAIQYCLTNLK